MSRRDPEKIRREEEPHRVSAVEGTESRAGMPVPPGGQAELSDFTETTGLERATRLMTPRVCRPKGKRRWP